MMKKMHKDFLLNMFEDELDFDYRADSVYIETLEQFDDLLLKPYADGAKIFYRGERVESITRPLLPTIYRDRELFFDDGNMVALVDSKSLYDYYAVHSSYFQLYENIIGRIECDKMYPFLAFSQHYFGVSPLIDFTKSLDVALSFSLKDRQEYSKDIKIYTVELKNPDDYTSSVDTANRWISDYSVVVLNNSISKFDHNGLEPLSHYKSIISRQKGKSFIDVTSPSAKLIDVPMNDLMRYQQGVFLLLDDFTLFGNSYLTKRVRDEFSIKKWIINKHICPALLNRLLSEKPYYAYKSITNLNKVVSDIKKNFK